MWKRNTNLWGSDYSMSRGAARVLDKSAIFDYYFEYFSNKLLFCNINNFYILFFSYNYILYKYMQMKTFFKK